MTREDELQAEMVIGDDARRFLESELGRTILGMADQEKTGALIGLATVDPADTVKIRELQNVIWRADAFAGWIAELIQRGAEAENILLSEKDVV